MNLQINFKLHTSAHTPTITYKCPFWTKTIPRSEDLLKNTFELDGEQNWKKRVNTSSINNNFGNIMFKSWEVWFCKQMSKDFDIKKIVFNTCNYTSEDKEKKKLRRSTLMKRWSVNINPDIENESRWPLQDFFYIKSTCVVHLYLKHELYNYKVNCWNNIATHVHDHLLSRNVWSRKLSPKVQSFVVEGIH